MKSITHYAFILIVMLFNLITIKYADSELLNTILLLSIFNTMTFPILYLFIAIETIVSKPSEKYNAFYVSNSRTNKKTTQVINELFYILKQPTTIILFSFPFLFLLSPGINISIAVCINIVFIFFALLNLLIISILTKSFYEKNFYVLICILDILLTTTTATVAFTNKNIFNITLSLIGLSFLSILLMVYFIKRNFTKISSRVQTN
jgi:hypothetical protein